MRGLMKLIVFFGLGAWVFNHAEAAQRLIATPITMVQGVAVSVELHTMCKLILMDRTATGRYPADQGEFRHYVGPRLMSALKDPLCDSWGNPYRYRRLHNGFILSSDGPDRRAGTGDDLLLKWEER